MRSANQHRARTVGSTHGRRIAGLVMCLGLLASCRASHAPRWVVPKATELGTMVHGSWAIITPRTGSRVAGELIAAHPDTIFIMVGDSLTATPTADVRSTELSKFRANTGAIAAATLLGVLSTASHGWYLILTAPIWTLTGTITAFEDSRIATLDTRDPATLAAWARFPAGLPPSVDRRQLRGVIPTSGR